MPLKRVHNHQPLGESIAWKSGESVQGQTKDKEEKKGENLLQIPRAPATAESQPGTAKVRVIIQPQEAALSRHQVVYLEYTPFLRVSYTREAGNKL